MMTFTHADAEHMIAAYETAGAELANATAAELQYEDEKPVQKDGAIRRVMMAVAPGEKPLSATAAEKLVESDPEYAAFLRAKRDAAIRTILAQTKRDAAKLRAVLVVRLAPTEIAS